TANTLARWLGPAARQYGDPETLFDVKTQRTGVGYSDKVTERANKANDYNNHRVQGQGVLNGVIFHTEHGVFFQLGIDHEGIKPRFGTVRRPLVAPRELPRWIDGAGRILPAILLTSKITWEGSDFANVADEGIRELNRSLARILKTIL